MELALGLAFALGLDGLSADDAHVRPHLDAACSGGEAFACAPSWWSADGLDRHALVVAALVACEGGDDAGCFALGLAQTTGPTGVPTVILPTMPEGVAALTKACDHGHAGACGALARVELYGDPAPTCEAIPAAPVELAQRACAGGDAAGCFWAGEQAARGLGRPVDARAAEEAWLQSCRLGHPVGCAQLAQVALHAPEVDGPTAAEGWMGLLAACLDGAGPACIVVANGPPGPAADRAKEAGCTSGQAATCGEVGEAALLAATTLDAKLAALATMERGLKVAPSIRGDALVGRTRSTLAASDAGTLRRACVAGSGQACAALAVGTDWKKEGSLRAQQAAELGVTWAQTELAWDLIGAASDAAKRWGAACMGGDPAGCRALAELPAPAGWPAAFHALDPIDPYPALRCGLGTLTEPRAWLADTAPPVDPAGQPTPPPRWLEPTPKVKVPPEYPEAARKAHADDVDCTVTVLLDRAGRVTWAQAPACPHAFAEAAVDALGRWAFYPVKDATGEDLALNLKIKFRLR